MRTLAREVMPIIVFLPIFAGHFLDAEVGVATAHHFIRKSFHFSAFSIFSEGGQPFFLSLFRLVKTAIFRLVDYNDRTMSTACVAATGGRMLDRSCRGRAAEADSTAVVRECTMREDAKSGIKKSISRRKNLCLSTKFGCRRLGLL